MDAEASKFAISNVPEPYAHVIKRFGVEGGYVGASEAESPWVPFGDSAFIRHLAFDVRANAYCNILWVKSGGALGTHKHRGSVSAMCLEGGFRYLEYDWVAGPGDFITEMPGTAHTLVSEHKDGMKAIFWMNGTLEFFDDQGVLAETFDVFWFINHYVSYCEANNLPINKALFL